MIAEMFCTNNYMENPHKKKQNKKKKTDKSLEQSLEVFDDTFIGDTTAYLRMIVTMACFCFGAMVIS